MLRPGKMRSPAPPANLATKTARHRKAVGRSRHNLLSSGNQALSADNMNNAAGILQYCAKQKLASVTDAENIKNQVLEKLGLNSEEQKEDTNYLDGIQGLLKTKDGQQLNLDNIGTTPLAEKVKTKACDLVLKQGLNFIS